MFNEKIVDSYRANDGTLYYQVWRQYNGGLMQLVWVRID